LGVNHESMQDLDYAIGVLGYDKINWICIDVAHGHSDKAGQMIKHIKNTFPANTCPKIIAGNVATVSGYRFLADAGADVIKIGLAGGSICRTRYQTGFYIPTAASVEDCFFSGNRSIPIIADGGIKHIGDISKAIHLGAQMVMCGNIFASCSDSPAKVKNGKKVYRGSTSLAFKEKDSHVEGTTVELPPDGSYADRVRQITEALQSSVSYAGGQKLDDLRAVTRIEI